MESVSLVGLREGHLGYVDTKMLWQSHMHAPVRSRETTEQWGALAWTDIVIFLAGPIAELK